MQSVNFSLQKASTQLESAISIIEKLRDQYDQIVEDSRELCMKWNIPIKLSETRQRYAKKYFDEVDSDRRLTTTDDNFRVTIFYPVVDTTLLQLRVRFKGMKTVCNDFIILMPEILTSMVDELIVKSSYDFINKYKEDISSDFTRQLIIIKGYLSSKFQTNYLKSMTIHDLADTIVKEELTSIFPDVFIGTIIFLTIPVTSASAERSFSKLKLIKNYLRNSIGQERLSSIAMLNIERQQTNDINIENIIDNFANKKARKKNFLK
ncbi:zinc finger MYM-type protein 1-like [Rhopalosiphum maidis]|uniref:zinc finger MYM-type protein 1-like n=1 Tax=Rhopalosiphum maidis TaxID=43146 RepID=UPI000EFF36D9|nr:zinc finger MYM-type protein 1-like [Rhopalosiphum maidis]